MHVSLQILALELERGELEVKMRERRRYIDSLRIIPMELFGDMIIMAIEGGMRRIDLALVCRCWRDVLLSLPRIWSNISIIIPRYIKKPREFLKRRIQLAKAVPLDITLSASCLGRPLETVMKLHSMILATGTFRWQSLTVIDGVRPQNDMPEWTKDLHIKPFSQLRSLDMQYHYHETEDIYLPIYSRITETSPRLSTCLLTISQQPVGFLAPNCTKILFSNLSILQVPWIFMWMTEMPTNLRELRLLSIAESRHMSSFEFPAIVILPKVSIITIPTWKMDKVTHLTIHDLVQDAQPLFCNFTVCLPALVQLIVFNGYLSHLRYIVAPQLQILSIQVNPGDRSNRAGEEVKTLNEIFTSDPISFHLTPTNFQLHNALETRVVCLILERWSQLKHISLHVPLEPSQSQFLETSLKARKAVEGDMGAIADWKLCADLETLELEVDPEYIVDWSRYARSIFFARRNTKLYQIRWGSGPNKETLTKETVCN